MYIIISKIYYYSNITGSLGKVYVGLKCSVFEPSSSTRHMCELHKIIQSESAVYSKPIYSDGGPDHRLTYISVLFVFFFNLTLISYVQQGQLHTTAGAIQWKEF